MGRDNLGFLEEAVMLVVVALGDAAYGVRIREELSRRTARDYSLGATYTTLDRLHDKELLTSWVGDPSPERGGRAKRFFKLTDRGRKLLDERIKARQDLTQGVSLGPILTLGRA
jgi:DNA-binding PadR family transcriptional regulator